MECKNDPTGGVPYWDPTYDHLIQPFPECVLLRKYSLICRLSLQTFARQIFLFYFPSIIMQANCFIMYLIDMFLEHSHTYAGCCEFALDKRIFNDYLSNYPELKIFAIFPISHKELAFISSNIFKGGNKLYSVFRQMHSIFENQRVINNL